MVEILKTGKGECSLSGKKCDGVFVTFKDGTLTNVFLSWNALKQLVKLRASQQKEAKG